MTFNARGVIETFNPAAEPLFRYATSEVIGEHIESLLPGLLRRNGNGHTKHDTLSFAAMGGEFTGRRRDGGTFPVELTLSEMVLRGRRIFTCVVRDITGRKRMEEAQRLFLASTSHDMGNFLTAIAGYAMELSDQVTSQEAREDLSRITSLTHTLSTIMRDLVVYSGISGDQQVTYGPVPIHTILTACTKDIEGECRRKGLRLRVAVPENTTVVTDRVKLTRVIHNLLSNAARYTQEGEIELVAEVTQTEVRIRVRDSGIGIAAEDLPRIFEPYYRHERAREIEPWGTGLGLATVRQFCDLLGGSVEVNSTLGVGSEFPVTVPCKPGVVRREVGGESERLAPSRAAA
jgi:PAS domain S-box-containing protein